MKLCFKLATVLVVTFLTAATAPTLFQLDRPGDPVHATAADTAVQPAVAVAEQPLTAPTGDGYGGSGHTRTPQIPRLLPSPTASPTPAATPSTTPTTAAAPTSGPALQITGYRTGPVALAGGLAVTLGGLLIAVSIRRRRHTTPGSFHTGG